jgi:hypothetical protein
VQFEPLTAIATALALAAGIVPGASRPSTPSDAQPPQARAPVSEDRYRYEGASRTSVTEWSALRIRTGACTGDVNACRYPAVGVRSDGRLTVVWRGLVTGAQVELRLLDTAAESMPSPVDVVVEPGRGHVTFVSTSERKHGCFRGLHLLWRSPTGKPAKIAKTTTVVRFAETTRARPARGCA